MTVSKEDHSHWLCWCCSCSHACSLVCLT